MASNLKKYQSLFKKLLPMGRSWENVKEHDLFKGMAVEFCRVEDRGIDLLNEFGPLTSTELLGDWEKLLGLPDECTPENQTVGERRIQVNQKLGTLGGINAKFFVDLAATLGFTITIENPVPFRVGKQRVGGALYNNSIRDTFQVGKNTVGQQLNVFGWQFYFIARVPASELRKFEVGRDTVGSRLVETGNELLECTIRKLKPANSGVVFLFSV